jgi:hypothetical protein
MATDKSEPRVGLIFKIGFLAIVTLLVVRAALNSYFDQVVSAEKSVKIGQAVPHALINLRADEDQRLKSGPMPIEQAMQAIVAKGRMNASPDIAPSASRDVAPLQGWSKLPGEVPPAMTAPPPESVDAGAPAATPVDGGAKPAGDAGAPKKPNLKK